MPRGASTFTQQVKVVFNAVTEPFRRGANKVTTHFKEIDSAAKKAIGSVRAQAQELGSSFAEIAGGYNAMIVAKKAADIVGSLVGPAVRTQDALVELSAETGLAETQIDKLRIAAEKAGAVTPFSIPEALIAAKDLQMAIGSVDATTKALTSTMSLAYSFLGKDIPTAVNTAKQIVKGFNVDVNDLSASLSMMATMQRVVGVKVSELGKTLIKGGIATKVMGSNFRDWITVAGMGLTVFPTATSLSTNLTSALIRLGSDKMRNRLRETTGIIAGMGAKELKDMPITDLMLQMGKFLDKNIDASQDLQKQMAAISALSKAVGLRAMIPILGTVARLREGIKTATGETYKFEDAIQHIMNEQNKNKNLLEEINAKRIQSFSALVTVSNELKNAILSIVFMPTVQTLTRFAQSVTDAANATLAFMNGTSYLGTALKWVSNILLTYLSIGIGIKVMQLAVTGATNVWAQAQGFLNKTSAASIGTITGLRMGLKYLGTAYDEAAIKAAKTSASFVRIRATASVAALGVSKLAGAVKGITTALGGWVGLLVTVGMYLIPYVYDKTKELFGYENKAAEKGVTGLAAAMREQQGAMGDLSDSSKELAVAVKMLKAMSEKTIPELTKKQFDFLARTAEAAMVKAPEKYGKEVTEAIGAIGMIFDPTKKGFFQQDLEAINKALIMMKHVVLDVHGNSKTGLDTMKAFSTTLQALQSGVTKEHAQFLVSKGGKVAKEQQEELKRRMKGEVDTALKGYKPLIESTISLIKRVIPISTTADDFIRSAQSPVTELAAMTDRGLQIQEKLQQLGPTRVLQRVYREAATADTKKEAAPIEVKRLTKEERLSYELDKLSGVNSKLVQGVNKQIEQTKKRIEQEKNNMSFWERLVSGDYPYDIEGAPTGMGRRMGPERLSGLH